MSAISLKSITGITSITTPAGVDNQLTLHNNNTTEAVKLDVAGNLHFHNHLNITGVSTASNFKTGTSNLHNTGLNVQDLDVDGHTNLDNVSVAGISTFSKNIILPDSTDTTDGRVKFGASTDMQIFHYSGANYIDVTSTLSIRGPSGGATINIKPKSAEEGIKIIPDGAVELYHDNTKRLETTSSGVEIPQALFVGEKIDMPDHTSGTNGMILLGTGDDLFMYHDGTNSHLRNNTGTFNIRATNFRLTDVAIQHVYLKTNDSGNNDVQLYYDNSVKLTTASGGVQVTGALNVTTTMHIPDSNVGLQFGNSNDMIMYHNGSNSHIQHQGTGSLYIDSLNNSADIYVRSKDNLTLMTNNNSQSSVACVGNGGVILYNQGNARFNTDHDGAVVTEKRFAINRNAGDPYLQFQTSGTTHATLYGGSSTGFRVFTGGTQTERVRIDSNGKLVMGHTSALTKFHGPYSTNKRNPQVQINGTTVNNASISITSWDNNVVGYYGPALYLAKSGSSTIGTNSRVSNQNSILGSIIFSGDDGDEFVKGAMIQGAVDGGVTTGNNDMPGRLMFLTTADGAQEPTERLRIDNVGRVSIGDNLSQTSYPFHIQGSSNTTAKIKCSGNDTANFFFDANRNGASSNIGLLRGLWNGTSVADIRFLTGIDTSNKDDGKIGFYTASAGTPSLRMVIDQEGTTHFSDNDVRTDIANVVNVKLYNPARFVARNGKHVERGFYSMSTGSGSMDYAHMKTDMATNSSTMFLFTCRGYSYGSGKVMFAQTVGYCYSAHDNIINKENKSWDGQTVLSTYKSSDGYVALQVDFGSNSSYYTGFVIDVQYANHAMGAMNYKVISATFNSTNQHFA